MRIVLRIYFNRYGRIISKRGIRIKAWREMLKSEKELDGLYGLNSQIRGFGVSRSLKKVGGHFNGPTLF